MLGGHGCEDARVTYVPQLDRYVMAYTAFGRKAPGSQSRYRRIRTPGSGSVVRFATDVLNSVDNKDAAFFPELVLSPSGVRSFAFFHRPMRPETINGQTPIPVVLLPPEQREAACLAYVSVQAAKANVRNLCEPWRASVFWSPDRHGASSRTVRFTLEKPLAPS